MSYVPAAKRLSECLQKVVSIFGAARSDLRRSQSCVPALSALEVDLLSHARCVATLRAVPRPSRVVDGHGE